MLIQIFLIPITIIILFVLFLPNKIELDFANDFWEIRFENLFFKHIFGSKDGKKDKKLSADEPIEKKKRESKPENKNYKDLKQKKESKEHISPKVSAQKEESREKEEKDSPDHSKEIYEIPEFENTKDTNEKSLLEWLEFAREIWEREEKTVKSLLKFVIKTVKLSLKLLVPAKINLNILGGTYDPAYTGWLYSIFILLNSFFEKNRRISLDFAPDFTKTELKFNGCIRYCFSIAGIILFLLVILIYVPYLRIFKCIWRNRKLLTLKS